MLINPNPTINTINFELQDLENIDHNLFNIKIVSLSSQEMVKEFSINQSQHFSVDILNLNSGLYRIIVIDPSFTGIWAGNFVKI